MLFIAWPDTQSRHHSLKHPAADPIRRDYIFVMLLFEFQNMCRDSYFVHLIASTCGNHRNMLCHATNEVFTSA